MELWRGQPLVEFVDADFAMVESTRLSELYVHTVEGSNDVRLALGEHGSMVPELEALVVEHPLRERLWAQLILAKYRAGRQAEALRTFTRVAQALADVGLEPGSELRDLENRILQQDPGLTPVAEGVAPPSRPMGIALPNPLTGLVGRRDEVRSLAGMVADHRLVTVTGVGGVGKTRLALEVVREIGSTGGEGARFVDVSTARTPELVLDAFAEAIGVAEQTGKDRRDSIVDRLATSAIALLVDEAEHSSEATGELLSFLLDRSPELHAVVTSREPLGVMGEATYAVPPLSTGTDRGPSDAATLFVERASDRRSLDAQELDQGLVEEVCRRLDGIPAAIELVASRVAAVGLKEVASHLGDVLDSTTPTGRQNLSAVADWSYRQLPAETAALWRRLSVFAGGGTFAAAKAVAAPEIAPGVLLGWLGQLADRSLIRVRRGTATRYRMLEVFRQHAAAYLEDKGDAAETMERHALHYAELAAQLEASFATSDWPAMLDALDDDLANLRAAFDWAFGENRADLALAIAGPFIRYVKWRGRYQEGADAADRALALGGESRLRAKVLREVAGIHASMGDLDRAASFAEEALALFITAGDKPGRADALYDLGRSAILAGDFDAASGRFAEAAAIWEALNRPANLAFPLVYLAWLRQIRGDYEMAEILWERVLAGAETAMMPSRSGITFRIADLALDQGDLERAGKIATESLMVAVEGGHPYHEWGARYVLGRLHYLGGNYREARSLATEALVGARALGDVEGIGFTIRLLGWIEIRDGETDSAARHLTTIATFAATLGGALSRAAVLELGAACRAAKGDHAEAIGLHAAAERIRADHHLPLPVPERAGLDHDLEQLRDAVGDRQFEAAAGDRTAWTSEEALTRAIPGLG